MRSPDISTLNTHLRLGISRYTYVPQCVCLAVHWFVGEQDVLLFDCNIHLLGALCNSIPCFDLSITDSRFARSRRQAWVCREFGRLHPFVLPDGVDLPALLLVAFFNCIRRAQIVSLDQDCVTSWTLAVLLLALFCIGRAQKYALPVAQWTHYMLTLWV